MLKTETKDLLKFNAEGVDPYEMWSNAKKACLDTVNEFTAKHGEPMYCGFANVKVYPARGKFIKFLKEMGIGSNGYKGGWRISYYDIMPQDHQYRTTQSLDIKEIACEAFRDELRKYGLTVYAESRAD